MNRRKNISRIFSVLLVVAAYGYLAYKLLTFDGYSDFAGHFRSAGWQQYMFLAIAISLYPLNIFFESCKWRFLLRHIEPMSLAQAQRQTYYGAMGAFLTPGRLGDYPTRVTMLRHKEHWLSAISLGFAGTFALSSLQIMLGLPAAISTLGVKWYVYIIGVFFLICFFLSPFICRHIPTENIKTDKLKSAIEVIGGISIIDMAVLIGLSALRYTVYCSQLACVMWCSGVNLSVGDMITAILAFYLFVTITPSLPVADVGIRGSWAIIVFSHFTDNIAAIAMAVVLLWVVNSVLPMLTGSVISRLQVSRSTNKID